MASLLNLSGGSLLKKGLPYDAEIEYLEGTGTQWIDTGVVADLTTEVFFTFMLTYVSTTQNTGIFGRYGANNDRFQFLASNKTPQFGIGTSKSGSAQIAIGIEYTVIMSAANLYASYNSTNVTGFTASSIVNDTLLMWSRGVDSDAKAHGRFKSCTIKKSDIIVCDYIPVRVGTTGYMYDKVSGQLFGNAGTGNFILGNDI